jgi:asparagine synthase (glutamine-hydrolysing)
LRAGLIERGHRFATNSDTEVLVHLYEERGSDLVRELNGMFAFAIWDEKRSTLLLARDPVGIKPLLYAETPAGIVFGSEMGSLLAVEEVDRSIDPVAVHQYLSWGAVPAPRTLYRGVRRLPPGHVLKWKKGLSSTHRYWHPLERIDGAPASYEEGKRELRELLEDSVTRQMIADVPLGAFLSGGVDSTTIVGLMKQQRDRVHTFSIGFSEDPVFDETPYARAAARFHGTEHREEQLRAEDVRDVIPDVLDRLAEPFGSASILPTFAVSRGTRRHMTVALSGDGADELFAGYNKYLGDVYRRWYGRVPSALRRSLVAPVIRGLPASRGSRIGELGRKARRFLDAVEGNEAERHDGWMRYASAAEVHGLLGETSARNPTLEIVRAVHRDYETHGGTDPLNRTLFTDLSLALPTDMLRKVDAASMLNSLEVRVPFLDHRIVELAMSMPGHWKMRGTHRKRVLKEAVADLLPPEIRNRPKAGFDVPVGEWLKSSMRDLFWDVVSTPGSIPLDRETLEGWYDEHCSGRADRSKILWAAFTLRYWETRSEAAQPRAELLEVVG